MSDKYLKQRLEAYNITSADNKMFTYKARNKKDGIDYVIDKESYVFTHDSSGDIKINYRNLAGALTRDSALPANNPIFFRTCFSPAKRAKLKEEGGKNKNQKYGQKKDTKPHLFPTDSAIQYYQDSSKVDILILVEGEFKAHILNIHTQQYLNKKKRGRKKVAVIGLPSMMAHGTDNKKVTKKLHAQLEKFLKQCETAKVLLLHDADAKDMGSWDPIKEPEKDLGRRLWNFHNSVHTLKHLLVEHNSTLYYGHIEEKFNNEVVSKLSTKDKIVLAKGVDDLLIHKKPEVVIIDLLKLTNSVDYFNTINASVTKDLLLRHAFFLTHNRRKIPEEFAEKFKDRLKENSFVFLGTNFEFKFSQEHGGTILVIKAHKDCKRFIRVGINYFKILYKKNSVGSWEKSLEPWNKATLKADYEERGFSGFIEGIKKYDGFINRPSHDPTEYEVDVEEFNEDGHGGFYYNLYLPLDYVPEKGKWDHIELYLKHIFGDKYDVALDYFTIMFNYPKQKLPAICLASKEKKTGKSTFIWLLKAIFNENVTLVGNKELLDNFNDDYVSKLVIAIDEGFIDKKSAIEMLKSMITNPRQKMNTKNISRKEIDLIAKIAILTNNEDDFIRVDEDSDRFWVTKVKPIEKRDPMLGDKMKEEVAAFAYYINKEHKIKYPKVDRLWFEQSVYDTSALHKLKDTSKSGLRKELEMLFEDIFLATQHDTFHLTRRDVLRLINPLLTKKVDGTYLGKVLKEQMNMEVNKFTAYTPTGDFYTMDFDNLDLSGSTNITMEKTQKRYYSFCIENFVNASTAQEMGLDLQALALQREKYGIETFGVGKTKNIKGAAPKEAEQVTEF